MEIFSRGNIPVGKYSRGFGDFFSNSGFSPQEYFPTTEDFCESQPLIKNLRNLCASIECQAEQGIIHQ